MSDFSTDFAERFAEKFATAVDRAGMRVGVKCRPKDCTVDAYEFRAALERPDAFTDAGAQSTDWLIEYATGDAPKLAEGDEVEIDEVVYRVRRPPFVSDSGVGGIDGTFRRAILTRETTCED